MKNDKLIFTIIGVLSVVVPLLVAFLLFMPQFFKLSDNDFSVLPHLHAILNSSTALCLMAGLYFIKKGNQVAHRSVMYAAFSLSALFLLSYVTYHSQGEHVVYGGEEGVIKIIYLTILISHIVLSAIVLPLILLSIYFAITKRFEMHKKFVKFSYPIWLYVAISGVLVYVFLQPYY